jgi:hypothetical protein
MAPNWRKSHSRPSRSRWAIVATQVLLAGVAIGSCGGPESPEDSEGLSQQELTTQADAICARSADDLVDSLKTAGRLRTRALRMGKLNDQHTRIEIADADTEVAEIITLAAADLRRLEPPASLRSEFDGYLESLFSTSEHLNVAAQAVEVIDPAFDAETLASYERAAAAFTRAKEAATALGFRVCGSWAELQGPPAEQPEQPQET